MNIDFQGLGLLIQNKMSLNFSGQCHVFQRGGDLLAAELEARDQATDRGPGFGDDCEGR